MSLSLMSDPRVVRGNNYDPSLRKSVTAMKALSSGTQAQSTMKGTTIDRDTEPTTTIPNLQPTYAELIYILLPLS